MREPVFFEFTGAAAHRILLQDHRQGGRGGDVAGIGGGRVAQAVIAVREEIDIPEQVGISGPGTPVLAEFDLGIDVHIVENAVPEVGVIGGVKILRDRIGAIKILGILVARWGRESDVRDHHQRKLVFLEVLEIDRDTGVRRDSPSGRGGEVPLLGFVGIVILEVVLPGTGQAVEHLGVGDRPGGIELGAQVVVGAKFLPQGSLFIRKRPFGDDVHQAARGQLAVKERGRSLDHLDPGHVDGVDDGRSRKTVAQRIRTGPEAANGIVAGVACGEITVAGRDAGRITDDIKQIVRVDVGNELLGESLQGKRQVLDRCIDARAGDRV